MHQSRFIFLLLLKVVKNIGQLCEEYRITTIKETFSNIHVRFGYGTVKTGILSNLDLLNYTTFNKLLYFIDETDLPS